MTDLEKFKQLFDELNIEYYLENKRTKYDEYYDLYPSIFHIGGGVGYNTLSVIFNTDKSFREF